MKKLSSSCLSLVSLFAAVALCISSVKADDISGRVVNVGAYASKNARGPVRSRNTRRTSKGRELLGKSGGKSGGQSGGKGTGSGSGYGWVDDEYYGCLALSTEDMYYMEGTDEAPDCDYVVHYNGSNITSGGDNENGYQNETQDAGNENGDDNGDQNGNDDEANTDETENDNESGGDQAAQTSAPSDSNINVNDVVVSSINDDADPYEAFDIAQCDTYEHLWAWDIKMSCGNTTDSWDCNCTYAEELMDLGLLSCEDAQDCPSGCSVCNNCLRLLGCEGVPLVPYSVDASSNNGAALMAGTIITLLVGGGCCFVLSGKSKDKDGHLNAHLMDDESNEVKDKMWMVPVKGGVPAEDGSSRKAVWLAPADSVPRGRDVDPHFPDVLKGYAPADQHMPTHRIATAATDVTSQSKSTAESFNRSTTTGNRSPQRMAAAPTSRIDPIGEDLQEDASGTSAPPSLCSDPSKSWESEASDDSMSDSTLTNSADCEQGSL